MKIIILLAFLVSSSTWAADKKGGTCVDIFLKLPPEADVMKWFEPCQKIKKDCKKTEYVKNFDCVKSLCEAKK